MEVFLKQSVKNLGNAGEIVSVADGFALNYLIPRKLAIRLNKNNAERLREQHRQNRAYAQVVEQEHQSALAEKIAGLELKLRAKADETGKLYGAIQPKQIAELLSEHGVSVSKSQIKMKAIKRVGEHDVVIKLSSSLQPTCHISVLPELS